MTDNKITIRDIMEARIFFEKKKDKEELPLSLKIKIAKFLNNTEIEAREYINKEKELIDKYAERDENGNIVYANEEKTLISIKNGAFIVERNKLDSEPVDCDYSFTEDEIKNLEPLSVSDLQAIIKFVE